MPQDYSQLIGERFGMLTVTGVARHGAKRVMALMQCVCDCGNQSTPQPYSLLRGATKSCGCNRIAAVTQHGHAFGKNGSRTYIAWAQMKSRCDNPNNKFFAYYGGRGITYCERWAKFEEFLADMGEAPQGLSLDRIDNAKGYNRENCRWADKTTQQNNRRNNVMVEFNGESTPIQVLCKKFQINACTLKNRLKRGWSLDRALSEPIDMRKSSARNKSPKGNPP